MLVPSLVPWDVLNRGFHKLDEIDALLYETKKSGNKMLLDALLYETKKSGNKMLPLVWTELGTSDSKTDALLSELA